MKLFELVIDPEAKGSKDGVFAISLVNNPAIKENFIALSEDSKGIEVKFNAIDEDKQLLIGAALIPDKQILRIDDEGNEYYVFFKKETIREAAELFLMRNNQHEHTLEHSKKIHNLTVVESWVKDSAHDKSNAYGFSELPVGTWFVSVKVNDKSIWDNYVKTGKVKGFSIEGFFTEQAVELSADDRKLEALKNLFRENGY